MSTTAHINAPALIRGFTALGVVSLAIYFIPSVLDARATRERQRNNPTGQQLPGDLSPLPMTRTARRRGT